MFDARHMPKWANLVYFPQIGPKFVDIILKSDVLQKLIKSDEKFDLVLGEIFLDESLLAGLAYKFKAPLVGAAIFMPNFWSNHMVGKAMQYKNFRFPF